jgi:D-xylose transport system substrate-binding protein
MIKLIKEINRKKFNWTLYLMLITVLISCKKGAEFKIGLMFPYTTSSRMAIETKYFKEKATALNCEVIVADAKNDDKLQKDQANELIKNGVNVLVIMAVNAYTAAEIVRDAHNAGVKVIAYDRMINNCDLDFYISHNNYNVGKYMAEYALKHKPQGKYLILGGDKSDRNAISVKNGQLDAIRPSVQAGKIKIVYDVYVEDWSKENACAEIKKYIKLSGNDVPDVILSSYDGLSNGVNMAYDELGIDASNTLITGQDAEPLALKNIIAGRQTMTIFKPLKILAENAFDIAIKLLKKQKIDYSIKISNNRIDVPTILFDPVVVDKSNIKETVIKEGLVKESDIFNK